VYGAGLISPQPGVRLPDSVLDGACRRPRCGLVYVMTTIKPPAKSPCGSCPYRCDVPSGVWDQQEYDKLPAYDRDTMFQPAAVFMCHQVNGAVCSGWAGTHDMDNSLALRMAAVTGAADEGTIEKILDYRCDVPLFATGADAAAHGKKNIENPGADAQRAIDKLTAQRARRTAATDAR